MFWVGVILAALLMCSCSKSTADAYSDFLMNGDILMRFEVVFDDIERGHAGAYTKDELRALAEDLEEGMLDDDEAEDTTELFSETTELLLRSLDADSPKESDEYAIARDLYSEAVEASRKVRAGIPTE